MSSSAPHNFDFIALIDRPMSDPLFQRWLEFCEERPVASERLPGLDGGYELQFFHTGVSMHMDASDVVKTIHIYTLPEQGFSAYQHELPFGATPRTTRAEAPDLFCEPTTSGGPVQFLPTDPVTYWDRWEFEHFVVHFQYPEDRASICRATVMSPSILPEDPPDETEVLDPGVTYFSRPTFNDGLPNAQDLPPGENDLLIPEDDWRQFEAVSRDLTPAIDRELESIQHIRTEKCEIIARHYCFSEVHIRKLIPLPLQNSLRWSELLSVTGVSPSEIYGLVIEGHGIVRGGFAICLEKVNLYGIHHGDAVEFLCVNAPHPPAVSEAKANEFAALLERHNLILIYWPNAFVIGGKNTIADYLRSRD